MTSYKKALQEYHLERNTRAFYETKGFKMLWNAFVDLTKRESFITEIRSLRKKHGIPVDGFILPIGDSPYPPQEWRYSKDRTIKLRQMKKIQIDINALSTKHHFLPPRLVIEF